MKLQGKLPQILAALGSLFFVKTAIQASEPKTQETFETRIQNFQDFVKADKAGEVPFHSLYDLSWGNYWGNRVGGGWANATCGGAWANSWANAGGWANAWANC